MVFGGGLDIGNLADFNRPEHPVALWTDPDRSRDADAPTVEGRCFLSHGSRGLQRGAYGVAVMAMVSDEIHPQGTGLSSEGLRFELEIQQPDDRQAAVVEEPFATKHRVDTESVRLVCKH